VGVVVVSTRPGLPRYPVACPGDGALTEDEGWLTCMPVRRPSAQSAWVVSSPRWSEAEKQRLPSVSFVLCDDRGVSIAAFEPRTTLPPQDHAQPKALWLQLYAGGAATAVLVGPGGERVVLPPEIFAVLRDVTEAMVQGRAITVAPHEQVLSTQEAAELIGVSRPTFVAILERGELRYEQPGRHRRVRLADVLDYQQHQRHTRRRVLDNLSREADELGITDTPAPRQRIRG